MENKSAFAKAFQKTLIRTKAKVLQNLGKAEKTTDDRFEDHVANFTRQQAMAARLYKEVKHYVQCVKAMSAASRDLNVVIKECYEPEWVDLHTVDSALRQLDMLCTNYEAELFERVCADLSNYVELFNPMKEKISKRRRKLLDYDNAKHTYEGLHNAKKPDEGKMQKAHESLNEAERLYNDLNMELCRELPKFYNYRIDFLSSNLSRLYSTNCTFHSETGKIALALHQLMEGIPKAEDRSLNHDTYSNPLDHTGHDLSNLEKSAISEGLPHSDFNLQRQRSRSETKFADIRASHQNGTSSSRNQPIAVSNKEYGDTILLATSADVVEYDIPSSPIDVVEEEEAAGVSRRPQVSAGVSAVNESTYQNTTKSDAPVVVQPDVVKIGQQVMATHMYTAQDEDELSFVAGEIIDVIDFDDPDDEDEGWLMGRSRTTGAKGVFPQNFTKKIVGRRSS
ncbi:bridging integrator 2-like isoform X2 [Watersipora subatra]|uniref:bridging integrator 2-like isoform X2 n=1 Tax=Watersipora subatra TaxID=2589382 RepID=UPI00355BEFA7